MTPTKLLLAAATALTLMGCGGPATMATAQAQPGLKPFRDEQQLREVLDRWREQAARRTERRATGTSSELAMSAAPSPPPAPAVAAPAKMAEAAPQGAAADSITNVQTAGVDEGGIVKRAGDHLVVLRRGRLFTLRVGGDSLRPVAMLDAYAPGSSPQGAWYDEMLISGRQVIVIGYSYQRGGTEVGLFELGDDGSLRYRATYHLKSNDYYSSRNYASRLIGRTLVFYTPLVMRPWGPAPSEQMPAWRRWQADAPADWQRLLPATRVYRTDDELAPNEPLAMHTVTACELNDSGMDCSATAVLGPPGRVFYVSQGSVYVWTSRWQRRGSRDDGDRATSAVFRIPLNGQTPSALKTAGVPIDQLSFLDDGRHLNVLLGDSGGGEGMWGSEHAGGSRMALLRVPLSAFGDGRQSAQAEHYRRLPAPQGWQRQNRFIGDWLLWGAAGDGGGAYALRYADAGSEPQPLRPGHGVERIEAMGPHAVLVGSQGQDLHFSAVRLGRRDATPAGRLVQPGARQGETRTHGFFFRPTGDEEGLLGLPVLQPSEPGGRHGVYGGEHGSASVLFLRQRGLDFQRLGELQARRERLRDDGCQASCVDWYGNARPIFLGERVFALMGYELVEGRLVGGRWQPERIEERRRVNFAPAGRGDHGRYSPF